MLSFIYMLNLALVGKVIAFGSLQLEDCWIYEGFRN